MGPGLMQPQAVWFARRGWVVAIVARRGYGASGGKMDKTHFGCDESAFAAIADEDAQDLTAAYDAVKNLKQVDATRVIATGNSAGGFASLALGAHAPPGLKAVINFSGGWHSMFFSGSCTKSGLVPEFRALGAATHVPTLWLYAKNDSLFGPNLPSHDLDPHYGQAELRLPNNYPGDVKDAFAKFLKMGPNKALAVGPNGEWSYSSGRKTLRIAKEEALDRCRNSGCEIIAYEGN